MSYKQYRHLIQTFNSIKSIKRGLGVAFRVDTRALTRVARIQRQKELSMNDEFQNTLVLYRLTPLRKC